MTNLGQYTLHEELGRGSYSTVYRATHIALGNQVALKVIIPALGDDNNARQRLSQEAQAVSVLSHPNIVPIIDLDESNGQFFIVSEFTDGENLSKYSSKIGLSNQKDLIHILRQTAEALDYAHANGITHNDINPGNILVAKDGSVHICDFGLIEVIQSAQPGSLIRNTSYISPEQAEGKQIDGRSDQYSLAVIAYEILAGKLPFKGDSSNATALLHITRQPPNPSSLNPLLTAEVSSVLLKGLDKDPLQRYASCNAFVSALKETLESGQLRQYRELIAEARTLLETGRVSDAQSKIITARNIIIDRPDLVDALSELENASQAAKYYEDVISQWNLAIQEAKSILEVFPDYPDSEGIFSFLGLRKAGWVLPDTKEMLLQLGVGMVLGLPLLGLILYLTFKWITR